MNRKRTAFNMLHKRGNENNVASSPFSSSPLYQPDYLGEEEEGEEQVIQSEEQDQDQSPYDEAVEIKYVPPQEGDNNEIGINNEEGLLPHEQLVQLCTEMDPEDEEEQDEGFLPGEIGPVKKRKSYANSFKLEVIGLAESIGNRQAAKQMGVDESNIREWRKRKDEIQRLPSEKRTKRHAKPKWIDLESSLAKWYTNRKAKNLHLTTNMVKEKGIELARNIGNTDFTGSNGWVSRFLSRLKESEGKLNNESSTVASLNVKSLKNKSNTTTLSQSTSHLTQDCLNRMQSFRTFFTEKKAQSELKRRNGIICLDEVPLELDMPFYESSSCYNNHQNRQIPPSEKIKFTVILSASASGEKLPPLVIFKGRNLPKEANMLYSLPQGIQFRVNDKGWITPTLMEDWTENCWKKWLWPSRSEDNVLILDSCKTHILPEFKFKCSKHFQLQYIPYGLSNVLHPLEISVIQYFKRCIYRLWEQCMLDQACDGEASRGEPVSKNVANYVSICNWILEAWSNVSPNVIMNGFAQTGIESFSPEDVVDALLNEGGGHGTSPVLVELSVVGNNFDGGEGSGTSVLEESANRVGDQFDGWD